MQKKLIQPPCFDIVLASPARGRDGMDKEIPEYLKKEGIKYRLWSWGNGELKLMSGSPNLSPDNSDSAYVVLVKVILKGYPAMFFTSDGPFGAFPGESKFENANLSLLHYNCFASDDGSKFSKQKVGGMHSEDREIAGKDLPVLNMYQDKLGSLFSSKWQPLIEDFKSQLTPEQQLILELTKYIDRVESHKQSKDGGVDFAYGFWFFPRSRAVNRHINYLLASKLREELMAGLSINDVFSDVEEKRKKLLDKLTAEERADYAERGIKSEELNSIFKKAGQLIGDKEIRPFF